MASQTTTKTESIQVSKAMQVHTLPNCLDPKAQLQIEKEAVTGVEGAFILKGVLTEKECAKYIAACESIGFTDAPLSTGLNSAVMAKDIRDNLRLMSTASPEELEVLTNRIDAFIPHDFRIANEDHTLIDGAGGLNERLRFYKYEKGQEFRPHYDGCFPRSDSECSFFTFIIYLSDGLDGGQTAFYVNRKTITVDPQIGQALIFWHRGPLSPYHAGLPHFSEGKYKYVLRSDVMYRKKSCAI